MGWHVPSVPTFRGQRQLISEFGDSLVYSSRTSGTNRETLSWKKIESFVAVLLLQTLRSEMRNISQLWASRAGLLELWAY